MNTMVGFIIFGLVSIGMGGLGVYLLVSSLKNKRDAKESLGWPMTVGQVTEVSVKVDGDSDSAKYRFTPSVHYVYDVNSRIYDGKRLNFGRGPTFNKQELADQFLEDYPPGGEVNVFYDPNNPNRSVLRKIDLGTKSDLVVGIVLIMIALGMTCAFSFFLRLYGAVV